MDKFIKIAFFISLFFHLDLQAQCLNVTNNTTNVLCQGDSTGSVALVPNNGQAPYTYRWNIGTTTVSAGHTITGLSAGSYVITIEDNVGCDAMLPIIITEPASAIQTNVMVTSSYNGAPISCHGACDGEITAQAFGGTGIYSYLWSTSATSHIATGLCAGPYCVTVADANGCIAQSCITLTEPSAVSATIDTLMHANSCLANDGAASTIGMGGTNIGAYSFSWSNAQTTAVATGLSIGVHCVTVTDDNGCTDTTCATIGTSNPILVDAGPDVSVSCHGACDASFTVTSTGGTAPYLYSSNGGPYVSSNVFLGLCPNQYIIQVRDANGCTGVDTIEVTSPSAINVTISSQDTICQGVDSITLTANASGGTGALIYHWSTGSSGSIERVTTPGVLYCVTATDANGCSSSACITPDSIDFDVNITNAFVVNGQKYGLYTSGVPYAIQTSSTYPQQTSYVWTPNLGLSCSNCPNPLASPVASTTYTLTANHQTLGCTSSDTINIYLHHTDTVRLDVAWDSTIHYCSNPPSFFSNPTSTILGTPLSHGSITYAATGCFDYTSHGNSQGVDTIILEDCETFTVNGFPLQVCDTTIIYVIAASCVWPGDTDYDGVVNNHDLLPIGLHYNTMGNNRTATSINYSCQPSLDWNTSTSGFPTVDIKHSDCNGNGLINGIDTNAIILNWAQTHLKSNTANATGVDIYIDTATVSPGDTVRLPIVLGTAPSNGYGIAFSISYDPLGVDTSSVYVDFNNSWLGNINSDMISISKDFYHQGRIDVGLTRIDHNAAVGSGAIGHVNLIIKDDVLPKSPVLRLDFDITNVRLVDAMGGTIPTNPIRSQILVTDLGLGHSKTNKSTPLVVLYPNPAQNKVQLQSRAKSIKNVSIYDVRGQLLQQQHNNSYHSTLDISLYPKGIYFIRVVLDDTTQTFRLVKD